MCSMNERSTGREWRNAASDFDFYDSSIFSDLKNQREVPEISDGVIAANYVSRMSLIVLPSSSA